MRSLEFSSQTFPYLFFLFIVSKGCFLLADDLVVNLLYLSFAWFLTISTQKSTNCFCIQTWVISKFFFNFVLRTKYMPPRAPPRKAKTIKTIAKIRSIIFLLFLLKSTILYHKVPLLTSLICAFRKQLCNILIHFTYKKACLLSIIKSRIYTVLKNKQIRPLKPCNKLMCLL